jgi:hypothetical protein
MALDRWKTYLQHKQFTIYIDQRSLIHLGDHKFNTSIQQKAFFKLMGFQYKIVYKKGVTNKAADALSRRPHNEQMFAMSAVQPKWLTTIVDNYSEDVQAQKLLTELAVTGSNETGYSLKNGVIWYKQRIWLGSFGEAHKAVLLAMHSSAIGGHSGTQGTYQRIKKLFYWPKMKQDVMNYVKSCTICQQAKSERVRLPGRLQPLPIPPDAWHTVGLDFVEGLPLSNKFDTILVIVDKFSKYGHFIPLKHPFTAQSVAQAFLDNVYCRHGLPQVLISDRDKIFISSFWQNLFKLADTTLNLSSSYHPQTDGQTERLNQCLETYLRCMVHSNPKNWAKWLPQAEYWYNTTVHSALGKSPFEVLFGRTPRHFGVSASADTGNQELDAWSKERAIMLPVIRQHLARAQHRMKVQADKHRSEREFAVGDSVYLKLQPYVQTSVATRSSQKLSFKYFGPYLVLQRVGKVAYKLQLPPSSRVHPVVHVSQLKKAVPNKAKVCTGLPSYSLCNLTIFPAAICDDRLVKRGSKLVPQVRVRWAGLPEECKTWEPLFALVNKFPSAPAWGHAGTPAGGNVTTPYLTKALKEKRRTDARQQIREAHQLASGPR